MPVLLHFFRRESPPARIPETAFPDPYFFTDTEHRIIDDALRLFNLMNLLAGCGKALWAHRNFTALHIWDNRNTSRRMLKKAVQQGRSERRGEATLRYVEPLSDARTPLADFFSILLERLAKGTTH